MIEINLIPDVKKELLKANKTRNFVVTISIFVGVGALALVAVLGLILGGQNITIGELNKSIVKKSSQLGEVEDLNKMLTIQNQLAAIPGLNDGKPITSRVLGLLDVINASSADEIEISNLNLDVETNTLTIEGQTPAGYPAIEAMVKTINKATLSYDVRQEQALTNEENSSKDTQNNTTVNENAEPIKLLTEDLALGEVSYGRDSDGVESARFSLTLILNEEFLNVKNENVRVRILHKGNATDSYLGIPESIFAERAKDIKNEQEGR